MGKPIVIPRDAEVNAALLQKLQAGLDAVTYRADVALKRRQEGHPNDVLNPENPQF